jgi:putative endonuclease
MGVTKDIGDRGEMAVAELVAEKGYIISARNYRTKYGEIDIIAENNEEILFIEVKTRASDAFGRPHEYVNFPKKRRIFITASIYLRSNGFGLKPRFDVAEVMTLGSEIFEINYIENAFGADAFENFKSTL